MTGPPSPAPRPGHLLEQVHPASVRARAVRRAFVDHVRAVLGEPPVGLEALGAPPGSAAGAAAGAAAGPVAGAADDGGDGDPHLDADLAPPDGAFWIAAVDGVDVGCVGVRALAPAPGLVGAGTVELKRMFVAEPARGTGLGRVLLTRGEEWALGRGARRMVLDTSSRLVAAGGLYRASGYEVVPPYNANPHADRWYAKELGPGR